MRINEKFFMLNEEKNKLQKVVDMYPKILKEFKFYDGKIIDNEAINKISTYLEFNDNIRNLTIIYTPCRFSSSMTERKLVIWDADAGSDYPIVKIPNVEESGIICDEKFNYKEFSCFMNMQQTTYKNQIKALFKEISSGLELLQKYNELIKAANEIYSTFSNKFLEVFDEDMEKLKTK